MPGAGKGLVPARPARARLSLDRTDAAQLLPGSHNSADDAGITRAAANLTAELVSDRLGIRLGDPQQNVARHHQHSRRAKSTLQGVALVEMPAQNFHRRVVVQAFERLRRMA